MPYLNVEEIETKLEIIALNYSSICELITLPNATCEERISHAIRICKNKNVQNTGVLFIGGVHAREWGGSDILIFFLETLLEAYTNNTNLSYGGKTYTADRIQLIINNIDIFIFPDVNPDGKHFSMEIPGHYSWRKNRGATPNPDCPGVDLNRNYDFLFDFRNKMHPDAGTSVSDIPCVYMPPPYPPGILYHIETYQGPYAFSEPETRNVKWLFDSYPQIGFLIDIHCYSELFLYPWGDDENQLTNQNMNFQNPAYDGLRGIEGDNIYKDYIPQTSESWLIDIANRMNDALHAVRGKSYTVQQEFHLYPTTGTSTDYAFSRNFVDSSKRLIYPFVIEFGTEFSPYVDYEPEMVNILKDVSAALTEFLACLTGSCLISSTTQNTFIAEDVQILRNFRDQILKQTKSGRLLFNKFYEKFSNISLNIMDEMEKDPQIQGVVKWAIANPIVNYLKIAYKFPDSSFETLEEPWKSFLFEMQKDIENWAIGCLIYIIEESNIDIKEYLNERSAEEISVEINLLLSYVYRSPQAKKKCLDLLEKANIIPLHANSEEKKRITEKLAKLGRSKTEIERIIKL